MLLLLLLKDLLGLRDIFRGTFLGLGDPEYDDDLPRLVAGPRPLRGEIDLDRDRASLRLGDRLRLRLIGDLLGGLRTRLGGERRLGGKGERLRMGLPRILTGERRLGGGDPERPLDGDTSLLLGEVSPRRAGEPARRRGGESGSRLGDPPLRATGDLLRGERGGLRRGEASLGRFGPSLSALTPSVFTASLFGAVETGLGGGDPF